MKKYLKSQGFDGEFYDSLQEDETTKDIEKARREVADWPKWLQKNAEAILPTVLKEKNDESQ